MVYRTCGSANPLYHFPLLTNFLPGVQNFQNSTIRIFLHIWPIQKRSTDNLVQFWGLSKNFKKNFFPNPPRKKNFWNFFWKFSKTICSSLESPQKVGIVAKGLPIWCNAVWDRGCWIFAFFTFFGFLLTLISIISRMKPPRAKRLRSPCDP